jgi:hypothetical protein
LAADWAAISIAAALETRVDAAAVVASATIAITNDDDHLCDGQDVDDCLHDGYADVSLTTVPPRCCFCPTTMKKMHSRPGTLLQTLMHNLRNGNITEDDHGKKFVSNDDEFFEASA